MLDVKLGELVQLEQYRNDLRDLIKVYHDLMYQVFSIHGRENHFDRFFDWLQSTDFFYAPATTKYHDSFKHGLLLHHIKVYNEMINVSKLPKFSNIEFAPENLVVALTHELCKIGRYESYKRNVKNDITGEWECVQAYRYCKSEFPFGNGVASMYIISKFLPLGLEKSLAIRWYMGDCGCCDDGVNVMLDAANNYPLVLMLQTADRLAIGNY